MGNQQTCCGINLNSDHQKQYEELYPTIPSPRKPQIKPTQSQVQPEVPKVIELPLLNPQVQQVYDREKPFEQEFNQQLNKQRIKIQFDIYYGPVDQTGKPTKLGKLYKANGALLIAMFLDGIAQGPCFYIMNDGSNYKGQMKDNIATCKEGQFVSKSIHYTGGFQNNVFHGMGEESSPSKNYSFKGEYDYGRKKFGTMKWRENGQDYQYTGPFNQKGQFHGKGMYTNAQGTYEGEFQNGKKQGHGIFQYKSKLRYEGSYVDNKKHGQGQMINCDGSIAYKGTFENGMPHGKGTATSRLGQTFDAYWDNGIDKRHLQEQ